MREPRPQTSVRSEALLEPRSCVQALLVRVGRSEGKSISDGKSPQQNRLRSRRAHPRPLRPGRRNRPPRAPPGGVRIGEERGGASAKVGHHDQSMAVSEGFQGRQDADTENAARIVAASILMSVSYLSAFGRKPRTARPLRANHFTFESFLEDVNGLSVSTILEFDEAPPYPSEEAVMPAVLTLLLVDRDIGVSFYRDDRF